MKNYNIKNILLTGDDGYKAPGIRILAHVLKQNYNIKIAATFTQQSGVGSKISGKEGGIWGVDEVDGIEALYVDGTPVDAIECAKTYFNTNFDLVISGINWGPNFGPDMQNSGTFSAAYRAITVQLAKHALAISWFLPSDNWFTNNNDSSIDNFIEYPGYSALKIIESIIENGFYDNELFCINLPERKTDQWKFTYPYKYFKDFYDNGVILNKKTHKFSYPLDFHTNKLIDENIDFIAVQNNYISVVPCKTGFYNENLFKNIKKD